MREDLRCLTLHQPWASLVALGVKTIETRSWSTKYRGPLAIHAAAKRPKLPLYLGTFSVGWHRITYPDRIDEGFTLARIDSRPDGHGVTVYPTWPLPLGAVVATCTLVDVVPMGRCHDPYAPEVPDFALALSWDGERAWHVVGDTAADVTDQLPYGDFSPGRYAWLLADIKPLPEPVSAGGRQQLWRPSADLRAEIERQLG